MSTLFQPLGTLPPDEPQISPNVGTAVGSNIAGVVAAGNWNDIPATGSSATYTLNDSTGAATGLTMNTAYLGGALSYPANAFCDDDTSFAGAGDNAMMRGFAYKANPDGLYAVVDGRIPYDTFDLYVYYNGSFASNSQTVQLYASVTPVGVAQTCVETNTANDASYVLSSDGSVGNYIKFSSLNAEDFYASSLGYYTMTIVATGVGAGSYSLINGIQIVNAVPEPGSILLTLSGVLGLLAYAWRRRK